MAPCIYCDQPADSAEHWLPRTLGAIKGLEQLKDRICADCNKRLGHELDQELANTGFTGIQKSLLNIEGRHGTAPKNPFLYKVMGKESATTMWMPSPHGDYKILAQHHDVGSGEPHSIPLRQLVFKKLDGTMVPIPFPPAYDAEKLKALARERDVEDATLELIYLDPDESPEKENMDVRRVLTDAFGMFHAIAYGGVGETVGLKPIEIAAGISREYLRAIAKLGLHYYLAFSMVHTGAEFLFQPIRRFIRYDEGDWRSFVSLTTPQFIPQLAEGKSPACWCHFFGCQLKSGHLASFIQLFAGPNHVPPPIRVLLGLTSKRIPARLHLVMYYDGGVVDGYRGEIYKVPQ